MAKRGRSCKRNKGMAMMAMRVKCYSVRLASLDAISDKACKAVAFDGSTAIIPMSQIYGQDFQSVKSEAWWISAWILDRVELQHSTKKVAYFDKDTKEKLDIIVQKHSPLPANPLVDNEIAELRM